MKYIKIKLARALRDKGFVEPCLCCFDGSDMLSTYVKSVFEPLNYNTGGSKNTSAPTYDEVLEWLRTKHKIHVAPFIGHDEDKIWYNFTLEPIELGYNYEPHTCDEQPFKDYFDMLEHAIFEALKHIK